MTIEVELKLAITPAAVRRAARAPLFATSGSTHSHAATYYDTPEQALRAAGISMRVRREDHVLVQTVKVGGSAPTGLARRAEWTTALDHPAPVADRRTPVPGLLAESGAELLPQFTVTVRRTAADVAFAQGGTAEIVLDEGRVEANGRVERFAEIEIELRRGEPAALFTLARQFDTIVPVRIGVMTKSDRGWRLLGPLADSVKAEPVALAPAMPVRAAFAAIAASCLAQYRMNEDILLDRHSVSAVHQARIALRRLRAALRAFTPILPGPATAQFDRRLRSLAIALGTARDLDVMIARTAPGDLHERLVEAHAAAWLHLRRRIGARHTRALLLDFAEWLECGAWRTASAMLSTREAPLAPFAARALDRLLRKVRRHGRHLADLNEEALHRLRKDAKKLRYCAEAFAPVFSGKHHDRRRRGFLAALEALQDDLGALNDLRVAREWLALNNLSGHAEASDWLGAIHARHHARHARKARAAILDVEPFWR